MANDPTGQIAGYTINVVASAQEPSTGRLGRLAVAGPCSAPLLANGEPDPALLATYDALPSGSPVTITKDTNISAIFGSGPLYDVVRDWQLGVADATAALIVCPTAKTLQEADGVGTLGGITFGDVSTLASSVIVEDLARQEVAGAKAPWIDADLLIECTRTGQADGGALGGVRPRVRYSIDGGLNWSENYTLTSGVPGATATGAAGPYDLQTAPGWASGALSVPVSIDGVSHTLSLPAPTPAVIVGAANSDFDLSGTTDIYRTTKIKVGYRDELGEQAYVEGTFTLDASDYTNAAGVASALNAKFAAASVTLAGLDGVSDYGDLLEASNPSSTLIQIAHKLNGSLCSLYYYFDPSNKLLGQSGDSPSIIVSSAKATTITNTPASGSRNVKYTGAVSAAELAAYINASTWSGAHPPTAWASSSAVNGTFSLTAPEGRTLQVTTEDLATATGLPLTLKAAKRLADYPNGYGGILVIKGAGIRVPFHTDAVITAGDQLAVTLTAARSEWTGANGYLGAYDKCLNANIATPFEFFCAAGTDSLDSAITAELLETTLPAKVAAAQALSVPLWFLAHGPTLDKTVVPDVATLENDATVQALVGRHGPLAAVLGYQRISNGDDRRLRTPFGLYLARITNSRGAPYKHLGNSQVWPNALEPIRVSATEPLSGERSVCIAATRDHRFITTLQNPGADPGAYFSDDITFGDPAKNLHHLRMVRALNHANYLLGRYVAKAYFIGSRNVDVLRALWSAALKQALGPDVLNAEVTPPVISGTNATMGVNLELDKITASYTLNVRITETV